MKHSKVAAVRLASEAAGWHCSGVFVEAYIPLEYSLSDSSMSFNLLGFNLGFNNLKINRSFGLLLHLSHDPKNKETLMNRILFKIDVKM